MVSRAMTWLWFSPHSGEGVFLVRVFSSSLLNKYIRVVRDFFSDSVVGDFVFGVSYLFLVLLFASFVETVLYSLSEGFVAPVGTVSGWSDVASPLCSVTAVNSMVMSSPCAAVGGRFFNAVLETDLVHAFSFGLWLVVQLLNAFAAGGIFVVLLLFVFASVGILVGADFREFPFRKCSFVDIKESASNGTMWLWVITTSGQADLWGGNNRPPPKSLPGAAAAKLAPRTVAASSQVCVREEGETKVRAKFPVFIQDLTGKRHCVMVEGGWDVHDLTRWAAVTCGVPAGAFYWTFQSRKWGDHGELMNDVGRDARLTMCGRLCGGANQGAKFGLPIEGEWTCSKCGMTRCWPVRKTCFRCGAQ